MGLNSKILGFMETSKEDFDHDVIERQGLVYVEFYRHGCQPCMEMEKVLEEFADFNMHRCAMIRQVVSGLPGCEWQARFPQIEGQPTNMLFLDGEVIAAAPGNFAGRLDNMVFGMNALLDRALQDPVNGSRWSLKLAGTRFQETGKRQLDVLRQATSPQAS